MNAGCNSRVVLLGCGAIQAVLLLNSGIGAPLDGAQSLFDLKGRAGDRSTTLNWAAVPNPGPYQIYRAERFSGPFQEIRGSPTQTQSIADCAVENGRSFFYRVKAGERVSAIIELKPRALASDEEFLEYLQGTSFDFFWREANPENGLIRDRTRRDSPSSIAAIGFGLTAIGIGIDHGWITRGEGAERVRTTLRTLWQGAQGDAASGTAGYKGWFYHFLEIDKATRFRQCELSSIDTALLLAGILYAREYFDRSDATEADIRELGGRIGARIDWRWMLNGGETLSMGWHPETGFIKARWKGYNEASILYLLGLGTRGPNSLNQRHWENWTASYEWKTSYGRSFVHFPPLFGHQYSACWIDFRGIADRYMRAKGLTYFENSRRATLAQRAYCIANPGGFEGYSSNIWGLTACDGPGTGKTRGYSARGAPPAENDDGTIAPTAAGGSLPFAPAECLAALRTMYALHREKIWCGYGFRDAFNPGEAWWDPDVLGIDQGPILIMAENLRTGRVWEVMGKNAIPRRGLKDAGFRPYEIETPRR